MENLKAKLKKQGGFTMVELLIVVAIIGILAAVSIPMFNSALEKARHGVDQANARDAISLAYAEYLGAANRSYFDSAKTYKYVVEDDHSADLEPTTGGATGGAKGVHPECTCDSLDHGLELGVSIQNVASAPNGVEIKLTGWKFDTANNKSTTA